MKVEVISTITHGDKLVGPGETAILEKGAAEALIALGVVREIVEPKSAAPVADSGKEKQ